MFCYDLKSKKILLLSPIIKLFNPPSIRLKKSSRKSSGNHLVNESLSREKNLKKNFSNIVIHELLTI